VKIIDKIAAGGPFYSLEFFPPKEREQWPGFFATIDKLEALHPLFVSVTYGAGGSARAHTLDITAALAQRGLTPMAHLTCVGADADSIRQYLTRLREAGVGNILALRGDVPKGRSIRWEDCEFRYASDLVAFIHREFPDFGVGVAAYLTPHPESVSFEADRRATALKLQAGSDLAVTQLFFDYREYFEYVSQMRKLGVTQPIVPGILPVRSLESMRRIMALSGGNMPAKLYVAIEEADRTGGAAAVKEAGIAFAVEQIKRLLDGGAPGIHLYTLNQADVCLRIAEAVGKL
jgi:methylenetetrahydrofolate reductase (NADPH)